MMKGITRTLSFTVFSLIEYGRSGRILIEILATIAVAWVIFRPVTTPPPPDYFFSSASLFVLALTFYTSTSLFGLGDRPQGYLVLVRRLGRAGYLIGLYLGTQVVLWSVYGALSLFVALVNPVVGLDVVGWVLGSLPLLLNVALLAALLALLAPMVLSSGWRLALLAMLAIAFSGSLLGTQTLRALPQPLVALLDALRTVFSAPLLPAFSGFYLAVSRDYSGLWAVTPLAQLMLTVAILMIAVYVFSRRELLFSGA